MREHWLNDGCPHGDIAHFKWLVEQSSLGTPAAKALRRRTPDSVAKRIVERAAELSDNDRQESGR